MKNLTSLRRIRLGLICSALFISACAGTEPAENNEETELSSEENIDCGEGYCVLSGTITEDLTLTADTDWLLRGGVYIGDDINETILTIEPGTTIYGESSTNGMLVITRSSKIVAEGTVERPIVFTSSKEEGQRARGDWGGVIINGRAPINGCDTSPCEAFGEGGTGYYGGSDSEDNSGVIKYVRVEFAGRLVSPDNELNAIAFQGVGSGTEIDYLQGHMGKDDCVEFFGGTAQAKHVLCTGIADDSLDWTDGWTGKIQYMIIEQFGDAGDNGIEADNNGEDNASSPRSFPTISNLTIIGAEGSEFSDIGILLREGTAAHIANAVVTGWGEGCLDIDHDETFSNAISDGELTGNLWVEHSVFDCDTNFVEEDGDLVTIEDFVMTLNEGNVSGNPELGDLETPDYRPQSGGLSASGAVVPNDSFFDQVTFRGAVDPANDWTAGWTTRIRN